MISLITTYAPHYKGIGALRDNAICPSVRLSVSDPCPIGIARGCSGFRYTPRAKKNFRHNFGGKL